MDEYNGLEYGTCPSLPGCQPNAPWTETAQRILSGSGSSGGIEIIAKDSQHIVTEENPSCHLPHIHNGTDRVTAEVVQNTPSSNPGNGGDAPLCASSSTCTLMVTTITQLVYETGSELDIWRVTNRGSDAVDSG